MTDTLCHFVCLNQIYDKQCCMEKACHHGLLMSNGEKWILKAVKVEIFLLKDDSNTYKSILKSWNLILAFQPCHYGLLAFSLWPLFGWNVASNWEGHQRIVCMKFLARLDKVWLTYGSFYFLAFSLYLLTSKVSNSQTTNRYESKITQIKQA